MTRAAVIGVGDELLSGVTVNTNAAVIGELLLAAGVPVAWSACVGDDEEAIADVVGRAATEVDVVIVTGGLGPTHDDRTREAIARLLGTELVRDEAIVQDIRERFRRFGRDMPEPNAKQGDVPRGAEAIPNPWGTAPGIRAVLGDAVIYAIPGVPGEARHMLTERVLADVAARSPSAHPVAMRQLRCVGIAESELAQRITDLTDDPGLQVAFLPGGGEIRLRLAAPGADGAERLADAEAIIRERCPEIVYATGDTTLPEVLGRLLADRGLTLATAESCTAGLVAARICEVPGASAWFRGGMVAYATDVKSSELGVDADLLEEHGAVCDPVARAMATGARDRFDADIGVSVTCVAGPDPQGDSQVGTTFLGLADAAGTDCRQLHIPGDRDQVRSFAATFAMNLVRLRLLR